MTVSVVGTMSSPSQKRPRALQRPTLIRIHFGPGLLFGDVAPGDDRGHSDTPVHINGVRVVLSNAFDNDGMRVECNNPEHETQGCCTFCNLWKFTDDFGPRAAEFHIMCWHSKSHKMVVADHRKWQPNKKDIKTFVDENRLV